MSATQEMLAESLRELDCKIKAHENKGEDMTSLLEERVNLVKQLAKINVALNEGANLLKG